MQTCPHCNQEILPYLKTGELKQITNNVIGAMDFVKNNFFLTSYQLYFCINCKIVYFIEHENDPFLNLKEERNKLKQKTKKTGGK